MFVEEADPWQFVIRSSDDEEADQVVALTDGAALRVAEALDRRDAQLAQAEDPTRRYRFWRLFTNSRLQQASGWEKLADVNGDVARRDGLAAAIAFYKGLALFLQSGERYRLLDGHLALLYAAWQWYNAAKRRFVAAETPGREEASEMVVAYQTLAVLLDDPAFATAAGWLRYWRHDEPPSRPLLREELRLSMVLADGDEEGTHDPAARNPEPLGRPFSAPGCMGVDGVAWDKVWLHPAFSSAFGLDTLVRRFIQDWLLPRYRYGTALRLAHLLRVGKPARRSPLGELGITAMLFVLLAFVLFLPAPFAPLDPWSVLEMALLALPLLLLLWRLRHYLEPALIPALALPRVLGGMTLGYAALVLEGIEVAVALRNHPGWLVVVWLLVVPITFLYLYLDVLPFVRQRDAAARRAGIILLFIVMAAFFLGLPAAGLAHLAHCTGDRCLPAARFTLGQTPAWLLLSQMPVAILIGVVTQFIWEERTATAPVWAQEEA